MLAQYQLLILLARGFFSVVLKGLPLQRPISLSQLNAKIKYLLYFFNIFCVYHI